MLNFTQNDIKNETDAGSYQRGLSYFKQDRVISLNVNVINEMSVALSSEVIGSGFNSYEQMIIVDQNFGGININGQCACPVGFNCKHVVAGCLEYLSRKNSEALANTSYSLAWLSDFAAAGTQGRLHQSDTGNEFVSYTLKHSNTAGGLKVDFLRNRYLKKGGLGKGREVSLYTLCNQYSTPDYVQDIDQEIALILKSQTDDYWSDDDITLSGELGYLSLSKMLDTGRCHWLTPQNPALRMADSRELQLNWKDEINGDKHLEIALQPGAIALNTRPALYIDIANNEIGQIKGADFTAQQWAMLLNMPAIPAEACEKFSQQLLTTCPSTPLPPPQKIDLIQITEPAVPRLFLYGEVDPDNGQRAHFIRLRYRYGIYEVRALPRVSINGFIEENKSISIHRDLTVEKNAADTLLNEGFECIEDGQQDDILFIAASDSFASSAALWQDFLDNRRLQLEAEGWEIEMDSSFQLEFLQVDNWDVEIESDNDWFDLRFDLEVKGKKIPLLPLIADLLNSHELNNLPEVITLSMGNSKYLQFPMERIRPIFQTLYELFNMESIDEDGKLRLSRFDATRLAELEDSCSNELNWRGGKAMRQLGRKLKNFKGIKKVTPPRGLTATLRDYQQQGLNWLQFLREFEFNGILADDMGLGKTVQTLAHLLKEKEAKRLNKPCLILAPTSLMSNWRREAEQFTPKLKVLILQGAERKQHFDKINQYDLILSTYPLLVRDHETLLAHDYYYLILDEAQVIKNPRAKAARLARDVNCDHRLCLTGTPMENHLGELWALFDFLMPGCLGEQKSFNQNYRYPIEKQGNDEQRQRLVRRIAPFMLRRSKSEVVKELPEKTEIIRSTTLDKQQAALYESIRLSMQKKVRDAIKQKGLARSHITILDALLKLRQTCCDPKLLSLAQAKKVKSSAKLEMLMEMLPEMLEEGRRILLFSQFTKMLAIIEQELKNRKINYTKLTGQTTKRDEVIERFKRGEADVFLISLKAGGVGLNLTEADTVIHYDPWWNPAVENQATDRVHRIGQNKAVFVYKLITENTLEEKILDMQARKQALADGVYSKEGSGKDLTLTADDLQELFAPLEVCTNP